MRHTDLRSRRSPTALKGFTLIELLVVVAIIGLLATIGYPSYTQYIVRANRSVAKSVLLQVADRQEQFFANRKTYAANLTDLGYTANVFAVDDAGATVPIADTDSIYSLSLTNITATTFTVNAAPQHIQAARDGSCQTMTFTHAGDKDQTGAADNCW